MLTFTLGSMKPEKSENPKEKLGNGKRGELKYKIIMNYINSNGIIIIN